MLSVSECLAPAVCKLPKDDLGIDATGPVDMGLVADSATDRTTTFPFRRTCGVSVDS